jgi:hypothetical protein
MLGFYLVLSSSIEIIVNRYSYFLWYDKKINLTQ